MRREEIAEELETVRKILKYIVGNKWELNCKVIKYNPSNYLSPEVDIDFLFL